MKSLPVHQTAIMREDLKRANRFRDAALPHLDSIYTLARYLLSDPSDAEDAVQECYLRALRNFDTSRNSEAKPWLFAILRNVCRVEYGWRSRVSLYDVNMEPDNVEDAIPVRRETQDSPETATLGKLEAETIRGLVAALPDTFREAIVLREINELSYREIAAIVGAPVGTVMSRLARGRAMLREAWLKAEHLQDEHPEEREQRLTMPFEETHNGTAAETGAIRMPSSKVNPM